MNLRRLGAIVLKELRQLRRDKLTFAMIAGSLLGSHLALKGGNLWIRRLFLTLVICLIAVRLVTALLRRVLDKTHIDARVRKYLVQSVRLVLWVVTVLIVKIVLGKSLAPIELFAFLQNW